MRSLAAAVDRLALAMHRLAGVFLLLMMAVVVVDIITRTLFSATGGAFGLTVRGAVEIVSYSLLFMVLFTLPHSVSRAQVIVDVFTERWSTRTKLAASSLYTLGFCLLGAGMSLGFYESALRVARTGQTTMDLQVPLWIIYAIASIAAAVLAIRSLAVGVRRALGEDDGDPGTEQEADGAEGGAL